MNTVKTYTEVEIRQLLNLSRRQFQTAKDAIKFQEVDKQGNVYLYPERVIEQIREYRENMGKPCKGQTGNLFAKKPITLEDIDKRLERIEMAVNCLSTWLFNNINKPPEITASDYGVRITKHFQSVE